MTRTHGWRRWDVPSGLRFLAAFRHGQIAAPCHRRADQRREFPGLRQAGAGANAPTRATLSSWAISAHTRATLSEGPSAPRAPDSSGPQSDRAGIRKAQNPLRDAERTIDGVWRRIGSPLQYFTPQECANYLRKCGICFRQIGKPFGGVAISLVPRNFLNSLALHRQRREAVAASIRDLVLIRATR